MSLFEHPSYDNHEKVAFMNDPKSGLQAIIAVHNTQRGSALGGCRMYPYRDSDAALNDVLRLSRGMTYKSAVANLPLGGAKSVIVGDSRLHKTPELLRAMGSFIDSFDGLYTAAEDSGISEQDLSLMAETTSHVTGISSANTLRGDPSPATAFGVYVGIVSSVARKFQTRDLKDMTVAVQGLGNVGYHLARRLHAAGAKLWVSDIFTENARRAEAEFGATLVSPREIMQLDVDLFCPCAMGAVLDEMLLDTLQVSIVAGCANNQLAQDHVGEMLAAKGILYAPDYVVNAGGVIDIFYQRQGRSREDAEAHISDNIGQSLDEIFTEHERTGVATNRLADALARRRLEGEICVDEVAA